VHILELKIATHARPHVYVSSPWDTPMYAFSYRNAAQAKTMLLRHTLSPSQAGRGTARSVVRPQLGCWAPAWRSQYMTFSDQCLLEKRGRQGAALA
jgi:hypothetical protein